MREDWRQEGIYRLSLELPHPAWVKIRHVAELMGVKPSQLIRQMLQEGLLRYRDQEAEGRDT